MRQLEPDGPEQPLIVQQCAPATRILLPADVPAGFVVAVLLCWLRPELRVAPVEDELEAGGEERLGGVEGVRGGGGGEERREPAKAAE